MKLKYCFNPVALENEIIGVPVGESAKELHGVLKLNKEGWDILELLQEETNEKRIVDVLCQKYEGNYTNIEKYVHSFIDKLRSEKMLSE